MSKNERRRRSRIAMSQVIKHSKYQVLGTPVFEENSALDISSGGVSFVTSQEYQVGTLVLLELKLPDEPLKILVCVAWTKKAPDDPKKYLVGAELIAIDPEHKRAMQNHLSKLMKNSKVNTKRSRPAKKVSKKKAKKSKSVASKKRKSASPRRGKA